MFSLVCAQPAYAYVDPGSGILLMQYFVALGISAVFYLKLPFRLLKKARMFWSKKRLGNPGR
jgi:hypothetical protein